MDTSPERAARRRRLRLFGLSLAIVGGVALALMLSFRVHWFTPPTITIIAPPGDSRVGLTREALNFWDGQFAESGASFRLGAVDIVSAEVPDADVVSLSTSWRPWLPGSLRRYAGDILIVLSKAEFISRTAPRGARVVIAIKSEKDPRMTENIMRNVIAHELGHALGLSHNTNPTLLMCGRPAPCRPDIYRSETPRFFPLSRAEKAQLLELYPPR